METDHVNIHHLLELAFGFPYCSIKIVDMLSQIMIFITTIKPLAKSQFKLFTNTLICLVHVVPLNGLLMHQQLLNLVPTLCGIMNELFLCTHKTLHIVGHTIDACTTPSQLACLKKLSSLRQSICTNLGNSQLLHSIACEFLSR